MIAASLAIVGAPTLSHTGGRDQRSEPRRHAGASPIVAADTTYVMLIRVRWDLLAHFKETGRWEPDSASASALAGHSEYWDDEPLASNAILGGGMRGEQWDNVALIIFRASSTEQAQRIVRDDPAVKAHVFQAEVRPFDIHLLRLQNAAKP